MKKIIVFIIVNLITSYNNKCPDKIYFRAGRPSNTLTSGDRHIFIFQQDYWSQ